MSSCAVNAAPPPSEYDLSWADKVWRVDIAGAPVKLSATIGTAFAGGQHYRAAVVAIWQTAGANHEQVVFDEMVDGVPVVSSTKEGFDLTLTYLPYPMNDAEITHIQHWVYDAANKTFVNASTKVVEEGAAFKLRYKTGTYREAGVLEGVAYFTFDDPDGQEFSVVVDMIHGEEIPLPELLSEEAQTNPEIVGKSYRVGYLSLMRQPVESEEFVRMMVLRSAERL